MDFNNHVYRIIKIFGLDIWITDTLLSTWVIILFLSIFALIVNLSIKKFNMIPKGLQNFVELIIESIDNMTQTNMGEKYLCFSPWFFSIFAFLLCSNLSGLFCLRPPTADLATTFMFALSTFFLIHFMGIKTEFKSYFKAYIEPYPVLLPLNIISEFATPVSLSFRLFGNILGGYIIMSMIYNLFPIVLKVILPGALHIYFDIFSGALQAFIFVILSMTFIKDKIND